MADTFPTNISIKPDNEGNVVLTFAFPDGGNLATTFPSADAGRLASQLLQAAYHASVVLSDLPRAKIANRRDLPILAVTEIGSGKVNGQEVMFIAMGNTFVALAVNEDRLAQIGADMQRNFWSTPSDRSA